MLKVQGQNNVGGLFTNTHKTSIDKKISFITVIQKMTNQKNTGHISSVALPVRFILIFKFAVIVFTLISIHKLTLVIKYVEIEKCLAIRAQSTN